MLPSVTGPTQGGGGFSPTKLQEVIARVIAASPTVGRIKLTKLIYLVDLEHFARHGTTLTGASWVRWDHGPMIRGLPQIERDLIGHEIVVNAYNDAAGHPRFDYKSGPNVRFEPQFRDHETAILDEVLAAYGRASMTTLLAIVYATPPMRLILGWEKDAEPLMGTSIPFGRALATPDTGLGKYRALADAIRQPDRGTPDERAEHEAEIMAEFAPLRGHVNREVLGATE